MNNFSINYYPVVGDLADHRDFLYEKKDAELREKVDLREYSGKVRHQSSLRSCTSQAVVSAFEILLKKQYPEKFIDLSALFVYYNARLLEGIKPTFDPGVYIKDALKAVQLKGVCAEQIWPYNTSQFSAIPTADSYEDAKKRTIDSYYRCRDFEDILDSLNNDIPVVTAIKTYSSFNQLGWNGSSYISRPTGSDMYLGGHSIALVGYDRASEKFIAKNSFGPYWADGGYFYIPFEYAEQGFMDSWIFDIKVSD